MLPEEKTFAKVIGCGIAFWIAYILFWLGIICAVAYTAYHFAAKFW